ncbi:MAG: tetratricopeptide repeat protein [Elusimicrobiota bacterium]
MRRAAAALLILALTSGPARAWRLWGEPSDKKIRPVQEFSDSVKPAEVVAALTPQFMQTLRGTDLRQSYILMGDNLDRLGRPDEALAYYQLGAGLFPKNVDLLTRLGSILHRSGLDERAKISFTEALRYEPRHWNAHLGLAEIDAALGFPDRAAEHYEIALETIHDRADVWRDYAAALLAHSETKTAELALDRALALKPGDPSSTILLAFVLRAKGDHAGAVLRLDEALARGADAGARRAKALWLLEAGRDAEAAAEAAQILAAFPDDAAALWVRARTRLAAGDAVKASADLTRAAGEAGNTRFSSFAARALRSQIKELPHRP